MRSLVARVLPVLAALLLGLLGACASRRQSTWPPTPVSSDEERQAAIGEQLFQRVGCSACHRHHDHGTAPSLEGLYGSRVELEGGETVLVDDAYLRQSILQSQGRLVKGYPPIMPIYRGVLGNDQIDALIAYIRSL